MNYRVSRALKKIAADAAAPSLYNNYVAQLRNGIQSKLDQRSWLSKLLSRVDEAALLKEPYEKANSYLSNQARVVAQDLMDPAEKFSPNDFYYKMSEGLSARGADDLDIDLDNPSAPQMIKAVKALKRLKLRIDKPTSVWFDKNFNPIDPRKAAKDALKRAVLRLDYDPSKDYFFDKEPANKLAPGVL